MLLAEDNEVNQRIVLAMLKRLGHRAVLVAERRRPPSMQTEREAFDVVLMDVQMPELSGLDAAATIRRRERYTGRRCRSSRSPPTPWKATRNVAWRQA